MSMRIVVLLAFSCFTPLAARAASPPARIPSAIYTDAPRDMSHPAKMEVIHIPSGGVKINGVAYVAAGVGPHPVMLLFHGLPGNEKNLDLAQAVRRAGWTVVTLNYRGSWGSPGTFRFAQNLEDAAAALAFVRDPSNAAALRIDPRRIVIAGHSMGGWVTAMTAERDKGLMGAVMISAANMGKLGKMPRSDVFKEMSGDMESLAGVSADSMTDDLISQANAFDFMNGAGALKNTPLLVLSSNDGLAPMTDEFVTAIRAAGGKRVTARHEATDHPWSDKRIELESAVIDWLAELNKH